MDAACAQIESVQDGAQARIQEVESQAASTLAEVRAHARQEAELLTQDELRAAQDETADAVSLFFWVSISRTLGDSDPSLGTNCDFGRR